MKLSSLRSILYSTRGHVQMAILYDDVHDVDIDIGTVDAMIDAYGDYRVKHIQADGGDLIITIAQ